MKARIKSVRLWPPPPFAKAERMEVRGSETARKLSPQTLSLPCPLGKERRINAVMQTKESHARYAR